MSRTIVKGCILLKYQCEYCGQETEWLEKELSTEIGLFGKNQSDLLFGGSRIASVHKKSSDTCPASQIQNKRDMVMRGLFTVLKHRVEKGDYSEFKTEAYCPNCKKRQSWCNCEPISNAILASFFTLFIALLVGFVTSILFSSLGILGLVLPLVLCTVIGLLLIILKIIVPHCIDIKEIEKTDMLKNENLPEIKWDVFRII